MILKLLGLGYYKYCYMTFTHVPVGKIFEIKIIKTYSLDLLVDIYNKYLTLKILRMTLFTSLNKK